MNAIEIKDYEDFYTISSNGIVEAKERICKMPNGGIKIIKKHFPKISITKKGYEKVMLTGSNKIRKGFFIHRLVAIHFIEENKNQVNHKDSNKRNNNVENLEFVSNRENTNHRFKAINKSSQYAGVTWNKNKNKWQSQKMINGKRTYLGLFENEIDAYNKYLIS
jgi:hypothetical protein